MSARFDAYVGIDYSGALHPTTPLPGIQVAEATSARVRLVRGPWSRAGVHAWLVERLSRGDRVVVGFDFVPSFPAPVLAARAISSWDAFLDAFVSEWRTDERSVAEALLERAPWGSRVEKRACDRLARTAKSPFFFSGPGNVGYATHAGIPWLARLRAEVPDASFWPFDPGTTRTRVVVAEAYPALYRPRYLDRAKRYRPARPTRDAEDAHAIARWLRDEDRAGRLAGHLGAPLPQDAKLEGWIVGLPPP